MGQMGHPWAPVLMGCLKCVRCLMAGQHSWAHTVRRLLACTDANLLTEMAGELDLCVPPRKNWCWAALAAVTMHCLSSGSWEKRAMQNQDWSPGLQERRIWDLLGGIPWVMVLDRGGV